MTMQPHERREKERQEVRDKILDAARGLFVEHGYEAVSMRKIAEAIAYTPAALYGHFKDKETLIHQMCRRDFLTFAGQLSVMKSIADPIHRLRELGLSYIRFAVEHPNHFRLMFLDPPKLELDEEDQRRRGNPETDGYAMTVATIAEAMQQGRFLPQYTDPYQIMNVIWPGVHGVAALSVTIPCPLKPISPDENWTHWPGVNEMAHEMVTVLLRGVLKHPAEAEAL